MDDGSWKFVQDEDGRFLVKGMLKIRVKPDDLNRYLVQLSSGESIELRTGFGTIHNLRVDACVGSVVELEGEYKVKDGRKVITKVKRCKRLCARQPRVSAQEKMSLATSPCTSVRRKSRPA